MTGYVFEVGFNLRVIKMVDNKLVSKDKISIEGLELKNPQLLYLPKGGNINEKVVEILASYDGPEEAKIKLKNQIMLGVGANEV